MVLDLKMLYFLGVLMLIRSLEYTLVASIHTKDLMVSLTRSSSNTMATVSMIFIKQKILMFS